MNTIGQLQALREYVSTLQRQKEAKQVERQTLYRELEALQSELTQIDRLYDTNRQLKEQIKMLSNTLFAQTNQIRQINEVYEELEKFKNQVNNLNLEKTKIDQQLGCLHKNYRDLIEENERMFGEIQNLEKQISNERQKNEQLVLQTIKWRIQVDKITKEKSKQVSLQRQKELYERKLQELASNYIKLQSILIQKQKQNTELNYQLSHALKELQKQGEESQTLKAKMNQKEIMIDCLQNQLQQLKVTYRKTESSSDFTENISKMELIKQANLLVERVNFLEKQNRGQNQQAIISSKSLMQLQELQIGYSNLLQSLAL